MLTKTTRTFFLSSAVFAATLCSANASEENSSIHINNLVEVYTLPASMFHDTEANDVVLNLDDLIAIALKNNKMIEVVRQQYAQSEGQLTQAWSGYLPHLTVEGTLDYTEKGKLTSSIEDEIDEIKSDTEPLLEDPDELEKGEVAYGSVNLSQLIYDFGQTTGGINVAKSNLKASDELLERQIQNIIFQVKQSYYTLLEKRRLIDVATESVNSFQEHLDRAKTYFKAGVRTKIDVINAEVELSNADMSLLRANYNLKTARLALVQVLGKKPDNCTHSLDSSAYHSIYSEEVNVDNILDKMPPVPDTLENLVNTALAQRPDIRQLTQLLEGSKANLDRVQGDYLPSISAKARYDEYDTDLSLYRDSWQVGVACTWDLFSGLHTKGSAAEAQGRILELRAKVQDLKLVVIKEVMDSYLLTSENSEGVQIALQTLQLAKENLSLAEKRYHSGAYDVIEYNDAQLSLTRARNELVVTYYGYLIALAGVEYSTGSYTE